MCSSSQSFCNKTASKRSLCYFFDLIHKIPNIRWSKEGLNYKSFRLPWTTIPNFYIAEPISSITLIRQSIVTTSCAESHQEFLQKCSNPLWQNPYFFIYLPSKKNEDMNPTKANHSGMNPEHYALALQELTTLQNQKLIEPTFSP